MPDSPIQKPSYEELLSRNFRTLSWILTILMALAFAALDAFLLIGRGAHYNKAGFWLSIVLAAIIGGGVGFVECWLLTLLMKWLFPKQPNVEKMRLTLMSIAVLAVVLTLTTWRDQPTNAQIDTIKDDPVLMAAVKEMQEKNVTSEALKTVALYGPHHASVNRYAVFAIYLIFKFVCLIFLFGGYMVIFKALSSFFGSTTPPKDMNPE